MNAKFSITKGQLLELYMTKRLSTWAIEKETGYSRSFIYNKLHQYDIPVRSLASSHIKTPRHLFSEDPFEKAYLIGFAVGDLRVRLHNKKGKSETISIACSSTKPAQIILIRDLFKTYGHIWEGKPNCRGVVSIEAFVDLSFSFLLGKDWRKHSEFLKKSPYFPAFLAGFTDAEGSIFFTRGMARLSWGNYDGEILSFIRQCLIDLNIKAPAIVCDNLKGYIGKDGYIRRQDYFHLTFAKKESILKLLFLLEPYIRHADKRVKLHDAVENIIERNRKHGKHEK